jgi:hypothetical protein
LLVRFEHYRPGNRGGCPEDVCYVLDCE